MTKKQKGIIIGSVAVAAAALVVVPGFFKGSEPVTVRTMTLAPTTLSNTVSVTGAVESSNSYTVYATSTGLIDEVMVKVGDRVKAGDVLCQFDVEALELNIAQSEASLDMTRNAAYLQLRSAQRNLENAQNNLEEGLNSNIISVDSAVDSAKISRQNARLSLQSARSNVDSIENALDQYRDAYETARDAEREAGKAVAQYQEEYETLMDDFQSELDDLQNEIDSWQKKLDELEAAEELLEEKKDAFRKSEAELERLDAAIAETEDESKRAELENLREIESERYSLAWQQQEEAQKAYDDLLDEVNGIDPVAEIKRLNEEYTEKLLKSGLSSISAQSKLQAATEVYTSAASAKAQAKAALESADNSSDAADTAVKQAELGVKSAQNGYDTAVAQQQAAYAAVQQQLESYEDAVASAQLQSDTTAQEIGLQQLYKQLKDATVTAPISGTITAVYAKEGSPSQGMLFVIEDVENLEIFTSIKEYDVISVQVGMPVVIRTDAIDGAEFAGTLSEVAPTASMSTAAAATGSNTVNFDATIRVDDENTGLRVGMNTRMDIILESRENTLGVPYDAIHTAEDGSSFVIAVVSDGAGKMITRYISVTTGLETDFYIEIFSDELTEGLQIIATSDLIPEGTVVQVA